MKDRQIEAMLDELERVARHLTGLADRMEPQRATGLCIGTSRTAMLALRELGLRADAMPVKLTAMSPAYVQMLDEAERLEREPSPDDVLDWRQRGAWAVVIGPLRDVDKVRDVNNRGFHGHVIVTIERRWIIDLTLGQASRPSKYIPLPATAWAECPPLARQEAGAMFHMPDGVQLAYEPFDDRSYLQAHDWTHVRPGELAIRNYAKRLRTAAAGKTPPPLADPLTAIGGRR